jgi:hypothetical protein
LSSRHEPLIPFPENTPREGTIWTHRTSGSIYRVVCVAYDEKTLRHVVVYEASSGTNWVRPLAVFLVRFRSVGEE